MRIEKGFVVFSMIFALLTIPVFVWGAPVPDTGQEKCYDDAGTELKNCPSAPCGDANPCTRTFMVTVPDPTEEDPANIETISLDKFFLKEEGDTYTEYSYYGSGECYDDTGKAVDCDDIVCIKKGETLPTECPSECYRDNKGSDTSKVKNCPSISSDRGSNDADFYGQDGNYSINPRSYTTLDINDVAATTGWVKVRDERTGLIWLIKEDLTEDQPNSMTGTYTVADAENVFLAQMNTAFGYKGNNDWRLPTVKELSGIVDLALSGPAIDSSKGAFLNMQWDDDDEWKSGDGAYWTSTPKAGTDDEAYYVDFRDGSVGTAAKTKAKHVIAVRKSTPTTGAFLDNGDTITDKNTGLMWLKTSHVSAVWEGAMLSCEALGSADYSDWRLPNKAELQSIADYSKSPAVDSSFFTVSGDEKRYWTSTTYFATVGADPADPKAWAVDFTDGTTTGVAKTESLKVLAVRGGQNVASGVNIGEPAQNSNWMKGRVMPIIWANTGGIKGNVTISASADAGTTFKTIVKNTANDGSYVWWKIGKNDKGEDMGLSLSENNNYNCVLRIEPSDVAQDGAGTTVQGLFTMGPDTGGVNFDFDLDEKVSIGDIIYGLQILTGDRTQP